MLFAASTQTSIGLVLLIVAFLVGLTWTVREGRQ